MARYIFLTLVLAVPLAAETRIAAAYASGELDLETALLYQVQSLRDRQALPPAYREPAGPPRCGTPHIVQAVSMAPQLSADYRRRLGKLVQRRPALQHATVSPSGRFRLHYDTDGRHAVDPTDADGNGVPDYIDLAAAIFDSVWTLEIDQLGYDPPPSDNGIDGDEYDVYFSDLGDYGFAYPASGGATTSSHLEIENDFTDSIFAQTRGLDALRVTIAHEFHHAVQFGYYAGGDAIWWQESTSTWMEEVAYPEVDDYLQYLPSFLSIPDRALTYDNRISREYHKYGTSIFSHFLDQRYGRQVNRLIWEELARRQSAHLEHFDRALRPVEQGGLDAAVGQFAVWNYFTGHRHRDPFYQEGFKYPTVRTKDVEIAAKSAVRDSSLLDATGSDYLRFTPGLRPGGLTLTFDARRGDFTRHLLLIAADSIEVRPITEPTFRVPGWDQYTEVVLVVSAAENDGFAYDYLYEVAFDPGLTDAPAALASQLKPTYPNPFQPGRHDHTRLVFDLAAPSTQTRLAIFAPTGDLVWQQDLGPRAARAGHAAAWDGRNRAGKLVASGVYHLLLQADGRQFTRSLAVIRE